MGCVVYLAAQKAKGPSYNGPFLSKDFRAEMSAEVSKPWLNLYERSLKALKFQRFQV